MRTIYYLGGSPCSGKSTVAERLSDEYGFTYFKIDDHLERYMQQGVADGNPLYKRYAEMTPDETWLRDPQVQSDEEFAYYEAMFPYIQRDMAALDGDNPIITEAAALLPSLMRAHAVPKNRYACMVPARDFQIENFKKRDWIHFVLDPTGDPERAFANWMERDVLFANRAYEEALALGYAALRVHEGVSLEDSYAFVKKAFELE